MNKTRLRYFENEDILHLAVSDEPEANSIEIQPNITAELNANGEVNGVEILNATAFPASFNYGIHPVQDAANICA